MVQDLSKDTEVEEKHIKHSEYCNEKNKTRI